MGILLTNKGFLSYFYCFNKNEIFLKKFSSENFNKKKNSLKKKTLVDIKWFYHIFQIIKTCKKILLEKFAHVFLRKFSLNKIRLIDQ